jgi:hypothetical protein
MALSRINTNQIVDGAVATADIADGLITTAKLADGAVTTAKVGADAVTSAKIADDAVTTSKVNPAQTDITSVGTLSGLTVSGDATFTGDNYNVTWDKSDNRLEFADNAKVSFGADPDLSIYHNGTESFIEESGTGGTKFRASSIRWEKADGSETLGGVDQDGGWFLKHDNTNKFLTSSVGVQVQGGIHSNQATKQGATRSLYTYHENFAWTSTTGGQAQTVTLTNSIPYQKPTPMTFFIYYTSDSAHHDMIHGIMDVGFYNSTFTTVSSNSSDQVANGITIGFTGAYNAKKMTVTMQPHSAYTASNFAGTVYYGFSFHGT